MRKTYEEILRDMLDRVSSNVDKREGSIIYDALAPSAYFMAQQNFQLDHFADLVFADTAVGEYLERIAASVGIIRKKATEAIRKMLTSAPVELGTRWAINGLAYVVVSNVGDNAYEVRCETEGEAGNQYSGAIQPISNVTGITAELTDIIIAGVEEEQDDLLRERFYVKTRLPSTSGNKYDYYNWTMECEGTGAAKVFSLADGPGTVKIVIADTDITSATPGLIKSVADYIEERRPIGATVTVVSAVEQPVSISAKIRIGNGVRLGTIQSAFQAAAAAYLKKNAFTLSYVSLARIGALLLGTAGIEDYAELLLNGTAGQISLSEEEIAVMGKVTLEVMT